MLIILIFEIRKYGIIYTKNQEVRNDNKMTILELDSLRMEYDKLLLTKNELIYENNKLKSDKNKLIEHNNEIINRLINKKVNNYEFENQKLINLCNDMEFEFNERYKLINELRSNILMRDIFIGIYNYTRRYSVNYKLNSKMVISDFIRGLFREIESGLGRYYKEKIKLRVTILFPNKLRDHHEYLRVYVYFEIGHYNIYEAKFYIGEDTGKRKNESGIAGFAYIRKKEPVYAKFGVSGFSVIKEDNDAQNYIIKENDDAQNHIALPIEQEEEGILQYSMIYAKYIQINGDFGGVICIDSMKKDLFDDKNLVRYFDEFVFYNIEQFLGRYADDIMKGWQQ